MGIRNFGLALVLLTALAVPSFVRAQGAGDTARAAWAAPNFLLTHQRALALTREQVAELSFLSSQVQRYQQGLLRAPSKPWIAGTLGTTPDEAARQAVALLSADQRAQAQRIGQAPKEGESV
jgi:hypothetical protein